MPVQLGGHVFEMERELIDVTSLSRPDPSWVFVDPAGHEHRWFSKGAPATTYDPQRSYEVPSIRWIVDDQWIDEFGDDRETGHHECVQCGAHVTPRTTADVCRQTIPGLLRCYIDGESVTHEEFVRVARENGANI